MAAKKVDPLKAKAARQKKIAIVLGVLFAIVLVIQVPRTLKMLQGPQPIEPAAAPAQTTPGTTTPGTTTPAPPTGGVPAGAAPPAADPAAGGEVLVNSDVAPEAGEGQLFSLERFATKDPFAQQVGPVPDDELEHAHGEEEGEEPADGEAPEPAAPASGDGVTSGGTAGGGSAPGGAPAGSPAAGGGTGGSTGGGTAGGGSAPAPAEPAAPAAATTISVNGASEAVEVGRSFPASAPTFVLVSEAKDGKSVQLGVAGGSYADGSRTITLRLGEKLTLRNTADGTRFELKLLAVRGFVAPAATGDDD